MLKYAKAIVAAVVAGGGVLSTALIDDKVTASEWVAVGLAFLAGLGITYAIPNRTD
jgi:hypothetical protein